MVFQYWYTLFLRISSTDASCELQPIDGAASTGPGIRGRVAAEPSRVVVVGEEIGTLKWTR